MRALHTISPATGHNITIWDKRCVVAYHLQRMLHGRNPMNERYMQRQNRHGIGLLHFEAWNWTNMRRNEWGRTGREIREQTRHLNTEAINEAFDAIPWEYK